MVGGWLVGLGRRVRGKMQDNAGSRCTIALGGKGEVEALYLWQMALGKGSEMGYKSC